MQRATRHLRRPSPAQAQAGNYPKAHVIVGGLDVTIETPMGGIRSGVSPNGERWSVKMPAHYGYLKRTRGADGDHVDVYVHDVAHEADQDPIWVVDQVDADTREFDEHKAMLGFPDKSAVYDTYLAGFSDGRGYERLGALVRLTFAEFQRWLDVGDTTRPLAYRKSRKAAASVKPIKNDEDRMSPDGVRWIPREPSDKSASDIGFVLPYGASTCPCVGPCECAGTHGDHRMTTDPNATTGTTASPSGLGRITAAFGKALGRMTPTERAEIIASAAADMQGHIGKASEMLEEAGVGHVEDLWDGAPDDRIRTQRTGGPGSAVRPGSAPTGSPQAASGDGAETMERQYSQPASQTGVQRATEMLGRDLMSVRKAMKSFLGAFEAMGTQIETLKAGVAAVPAPLDAGAIETMISAAVAKAMPALALEVAKGLATTKPAAKAEGEEEDKPEEKADSAAVKAEMEEEGEEDDDKEKEASKSAALLRLSAKALVAKARAVLAKAREDEDEGDKEKGAALRERAKAHLEKAMSYVVAAKGLRGDKAGPSTEKVLAAIGKAAKATGSVAENQTKWPNVSGAGEATASKADPNAMTPESLSKALEQINKAASGLAMFQTDMKGLFDVMSGQSRGSTNLPPVFSLAKAGADDLTSREAEIMGLAQTGAISFDDAERARDVIGLTRSAAPVELIRPKIGRLPETVQAILNKAA